MSLHTAVAAGLALVTIGYLVIQFGVLVLDDLAAGRETARDVDFSADTEAWLRSLRAPVEVRPVDASSLDALVGGLLAQQMVPVQRQPGESS